MKTFKTISLVLLTAVMQLSTAFAGSHEVKAELSNLIPIEVEAEKPVQDLSMGTGDKVDSPRTKIDVHKLGNMTADQEASVKDVNFSSKEIQHYEQKHLELRLQQLIPISQEVESASNDNALKREESDEN